MKTESKIKKGRSNLVTSNEEKVKRSLTLSEGWKQRDDYLREIKNHPCFNSFRSFRYTISGQNSGNSNEWNNYKAFYKDMVSSYFDGAKLNRIDKTKPFSKGNCYWATPVQQAQYNAKTITYNGETKTLREWANYLEISYSGLRQRFYKGKKYTSEEILFGKKRKVKRELLNENELQEKDLRIKASKMMSQYRLKDKKQGFKVVNISIESFIKNVLKNNCVYCDADSHIGADRISNLEGHSLENIVPACYSCNITRGNRFTYEEMKKLGNFIKNEVYPNRK